MYFYELFTHNYARCLKILDKVASEAIRLFGPGTCKGLPLIKAVIKNKDTKTPITNKNIPKVFMIITK